jgi:hypothetical protein
LSIDQSLDELIAESDDLHADATRTTAAALSDVVDHGEQTRASGGFDRDEVEAFNQARRACLGTSLVALGAVGAFGIATAVLGIIDAAPAFGDAAPDIAAAQTAASIENLAIAVYTTVAGLPFMGNIAAPAGPTVSAFVSRTVSQHKDHLQAFNSAASRLGGKAQTAMDSVVYDTVVTPELPSLTSPLLVAQFAAELESVAAATYAAATSAVTDKLLRSSFAAIMGVESQHAAVLHAVATLLQGGTPQLIAIPVNVADLPAAAGSAGFPQAFVQTTTGRPLTEGAVK